jgi:hypothetical protein
VSPSLWQSPPAPAVIPGKQQVTLSLGRARATAILCTLSTSEGSLRVAKPFPVATAADITIQTTSGLVTGVVSFDACKNDYVGAVQKFRFMWMDEKNRARLESVLKQIGRESHGPSLAVNPRRTSRSKSARRGLPALLPIERQEQVGSLVSGVGLVWATHVGTTTMRFESLIAKPGNIEVCGAGVLIWLLAKWRRAAQQARV